MDNLQLGNQEKVILIHQVLLWNQIIFMDLEVSILEIILNLQIKIQFILLLQQELSIILKQINRNSFLNIQMILHAQMFMIDMQQLVKLDKYLQFIFGKSKIKWNHLKLLLKESYVKVYNAQHFQMMVRNQPPSVWMMIILWLFMMLIKEWMLD